jgi:hypothetical protein
MVRSFQDRAQRRSCSGEVRTHGALSHPKHGCDLTDGTIIAIVQDHGLLLTEGEARDRAPDIETIVDIVLSGEESLDRAPTPGRSLDLVHRGRCHPATGPRLVSEPLPPLEGAREGLLSGVHGGVSISTEQIHGAKDHRCLA